MDVVWFVCLCFLLFPFSFLSARVCTGLLVHVCMSAQSRDSPRLNERKEIMMTLGQVEKWIGVGKYHPSV